MNFFSAIVLIFNDIEYFDWFSQSGNHCKDTNFDGMLCLFCVKKKESFSTFSFVDGLLFL